MRKLLLLLLPVIFIAGNAAAQKEKKEPIVKGEISRRKLERYPWFKTAYASAAVSDSSIRALTPLLQGVNVIVILGTWCSDSHEHVPVFLKIADNAKLRSKDIRFIGVDRNKRTPKPDIARLNIEHVPTFIFMRNKKEIGRIVEEPAESMSIDMLKLLGNAVKE